HRVRAVLPFDHVAAVARIPDEQVVTRAEPGDVVPLVAVDHVVTVAADQRLGSGASGDRVVAGSAVDRGRDLVGEDTVDLVDSEEVVAAEAVYRDVRDVRALEAEVRRTVVTDIDLEGAGIVRLETESDFVAGMSARHGQHPAP